MHGATVQVLCNSASKRHCKCVISHLSQTSGPGGVLGLRFLTTRAGEQITTLGAVCGVRVCVCPCAGGPPQTLMGSEGFFQK